MFICPTSAPSMLPDPEILVEGLRKACEEMKETVTTTSVKRRAPRRAAGRVE